MVIVSSIYEVAFRSYSSFSTEMLKSVSSDTKTRRPMLKHTLRMTRYSYGFLTRLKLFALLYLIHLRVLQMHELLCLNCIALFHQYTCC